MTMIKGTSHKSLRGGHKDVTVVSLEQFILQKVDFSSRHNSQEGDFYHCKRIAYAMLCILMCHMP